MKVQDIIKSLENKDTDLQTKFDSASHVVSQLMKSESKIQLPSSDQLQVYGLFKQANKGDVNIPKPQSLVSAFFETEEQAKWNAWNSQKGIDPEVAKQKYVDLAISLLNTYKSQLKDVELEQQCPIKLAAKEARESANKPATKIVAAQRPASPKK